MTDTPSHTRATLSDLTRTQQNVLADLRNRPLWRVHNGWRQQGGSQITLATGTSLLRLGLVEQTAGSLRLTFDGRMLAEEVLQHRRKRVSGQKARA